MPRLRFDYRNRDLVSFTCTSDRSKCGRALACTALVPVEYVGVNPAGPEALLYGGMCEKAVDAASAIAFVAAQIEFKLAS